MPLLAEITRAAYRGELERVVAWLQKTSGHVDALDEDGQGLLHAAAIGGRQSVAKELLQRGASVDLRGRGDITPLMPAAMEGQHTMVRLLLKHKASIDLLTLNGVTALMYASSRGQMECVQELLEAGASTKCGSQTALERAEAAGHAAVAELLHQHAAKPPATAATPTPNLSGRRVRIGGLQARPELNGRCGVAGLFYATKGRYKVAVEGEAEAVLLKPANLQDIGRASAAACPPEQAPAALAGTLSQLVPLPLEVLMLATTSNCSGELQQVVGWLQKGGHVDTLAENGAGLLHAAATAGRLHAVKELLRLGASVDLRAIEGFTALMAAVHGEHLCVVEELLRRGASVDLCDAKDQTALMVAALTGQRAIVHLLIEHKANVDLQYTDGDTALMNATHKGHTECVQELLEAGASSKLCHPDGGTALQIAELRGHAAIAELLRRHATSLPATAKPSAPPTPSLVGRRVRIGGLQARPELNGRCGVAELFDVAKGRYKVAVEGEAEAVMLKPANLQYVGKASATPSSAEPAAHPPERPPIARTGTLCDDEEEAVSLSDVKEKLESCSEKVLKKMLKDMELPVTGKVGSPAPSIPAPALARPSARPSATHP